METELIVLTVLIGLVTGFINTLAGSGSLVTLPFLIFLGLPADVANGTNRINLLMQSFIGGITLQKQTKFPISGSAIWVIPSLLGALGGAFLAVVIDADVMETVIGVVIAIMLIPLLLNPKKWFRDVQGEENKNLRALNMVMFFFCGIYAGFIQAGTGVFFLAILVLVVKYTLPQANVIKNLIIFVYTIPVLIIFVMNDKVNWEIGLTMGTGQAVGAWIAGRFAGKSQKAAVWIHRLLVVMVVASSLKLFGVFEWVISLF